MEFAHAAHQACYERVAGLIKECFGDMAQADEEQTSFSLSMGSTMAKIMVIPWGDGDATVCVRAYVLIGAEVTLELCRHLLHLNDNMRFGAFGLDNDDWVYFEHTVVGSTIDKNELKTSVSLR